MNDLLIRNVDGYIKTWNHQKAYGWMRVSGLLSEDNDDDYTDVFIHAAEVRNSNKIQLGACVHCDVFQNEQGWRVAGGAEVQGGD